MYTDADHHEDAESGWLLFERVEILVDEPLETEFDVCNDGDNDDEDVEIDDDIDILVLFFDGVASAEWGAMAGTGLQGVHGVGNLMDNYYYWIIIIVNVSI